MSEQKWPEKIIVEGLPKRAESYFRKMYLCEFKPEIKTYADNDVWIGVDLSQDTSDAKKTT